MVRTWKMSCHKYVVCKLLALVLNYGVRKQLQNRVCKIQEAIKVSLFTLIEPVLNKVFTVSRSGSDIIAFIQLP